MPVARLIQHPAPGVMLFNSYDYLIFLPLVMLLFFAAPHRWRWLVLLAASALFYAWFIPAYLLIIGGTIVIDYFVGLGLGRTTEATARRWWLWLSLAANLGILGVFKYFNFLNANLTVLTGVAGLANPLPALTLALPLGLSFHTFQAMSYIVEVYRGKVAPERHFGRYALYVLFFPQMVAGPIERPQNMLPQFRRVQRFDPEGATRGLRRILWGLCKKVLMADRLAPYVDEVFNHAGQQHGLPVAVAIYFFAFQIYCDFSGYSDIAVGSARLLGFDLMENFRRPYLAANIREFWQRWHLSLSTWFRDYLYIPLGGSRVARPRVYANVFLVFLVSGLWHGANWTFVIWGALHGLFTLGSMARHAGRAPATGLRRAFGVFVTFHLVAVAWVFFRAASLADALTVLRSLGDWRDPRWLLPGGNPTEFALSLAGIAVLLGVECIQARAPQPDALRRAPVAMRWAAYFAGALALIFLSPFGGKTFIYFQF